MATASKFASANAVVTTGWTSPTNAYADDTSYATASPGRNVTVNSDFKFADFASGDIPDGSTINSVTITARAWGSNATYMTEGIRGRVSGADNGTEGTTTSTTEVTISCTLSGVTLADLRAASTTVFARVRASKGATNTTYTGSLDWVQITVDYTGPVAKTGTLETGTGTDTAIKSEAKSGTESGTGTDTASLAAAIVRSGGGTATVTPSWPFTTDPNLSESPNWSEQEWLSTGGNPGGYIVLAADSYWGDGNRWAYLTGTWESLFGVPSGSTVTRAKLLGVDYVLSVGGQENGSGGGVDLCLTANGSSLASLCGDQALSVAWDSVGAQAWEDFADQASSATIYLRFHAYAAYEGADSTATAGWDNLSLEIEYTGSGGAAETGTATDTATKSPRNYGTDDTYKPCSDDKVSYPGSGKPENESGKSGY